LSHELTDLTPDTVYHVVITASNELGEGYKPKLGQMVKTMRPNLASTGSLFVWGDNNYSQLGLQEVDVNANKYNYPR